MLLSFHKRRLVGRLGPTSSQTRLDEMMSFEDVMMPHMSTYTTGKIRVERGLFGPKIMMEVCVQEWLPSFSHSVLLEEKLKWRRAANKDIEWMMTLFQRNMEFDVKASHGSSGYDTGSDR